jgi:hypothetical protein
MAGLLLNAIIDSFIPIYIIIVIVIIIYHRYITTKLINTSQPFLKRAKPQSTHHDTNESGNSYDDLDWLQNMNGIFLCYKAPESESWFSFVGLNYLKRLAACTLLLRLKQTIKISNGKLDFFREYGNGMHPWGITDLVIGESEGTAISQSKVLTDNGDVYDFKAWIDREQNTFSFLSTPHDKSLLTYLHVRSWDGNDLYTVSYIILILNKYIYSSTNK